MQRELHLSKLFVELNGGNWPIQRENGGKERPSPTTTTGALGQMIQRKQKPQPKKRQWREGDSLCVTLSLYFWLDFCFYTGHKQELKLECVNV